VKAKKRKRLLWSSVIVVLIVTAALIGCAAARQRVQAANAPASGDVFTAFIGDLSASASASGKLLPQRDVQLALGTQGQVQDLYVQVGDQVQEGDVLLVLESKDLERSVASAEQTVAINKANLDKLLRAADPEDIAAAEAAVTSAQTQLDDLLDGPSDEDLARARASLDSAQARLDDVLAGPTQAEMDQALAALSSAKAGLAAAQARYAALDDQKVIAQNDIHNAQLAIDQARDMYNMLIWSQPRVADSWGPYSPQAAALRNAQIGYDAAVANYTLTEINDNDSSLRSAETQVAQAEAALAALNDERTAQIAAAKAQVAQADANLAKLLEKQTTQIASVEAQLAQAKANLEKLLDGASEQQLAIARAQLEQSLISLEDAQDNLDAATLTAPFDGTVTAVHTAVGEYASGVVIELIDTASLRVVLNVDEVDIGSIKVGQPTRVTLESWPDRELDGEVTMIAPKGRNVGGIVTYEVQLSLDAGDLPILAGMTANADLVTAQKTQVLLVPNRAITADRQTQEYFVNKVVGDSLEKVQVTIGMRDSTYTEITSGLQAGDRVYTGEIDDGFDFMSGPPEGIH